MQRKNLGILKSIIGAQRAGCYTRGILGVVALVIVFARAAVTQSGIQAALFEALDLSTI